ncbi:MAG TPA: 3'-5' exonuclease, partial [Ideonella sp.]|nr:3'-5' exonuclease [Ideonella sp.]
QIERIHDDAHVRKLDVDQLVRLAAGYPSRERFLTELTLDPPQSTSDQSGVPHLDEDYLILSTIHSAKGQEWKAVHVLNVVDGCIPSDLATGRAAEIEEERRLLYVAMTRAKHHLALLVPQRFHVTQQGAFGDRHLYGSLSRFVPPAVAALFDAVAPPAPTGAAGDAVAAGDAAAPVDVGARVRALWE